MKYIITLVLLNVGLHSYCQDIIYKRSHLGYIEVYKSKNGVVQGKPIARVSKNQLGYIEVKSLEKDEGLSNEVNPYSEKPKLIPVKPFMASTAQAFNTFNTYIDLIKDQRQVSQKSTYDDEGVKRLKGIYKSMENRFTDLMTLYSQIEGKPKFINSGWHNVTIVSKVDLTSAGLGDKITKIGYAFVENNKVQKLIAADFTGGVMFETDEITSSNSIEDCKAYYKIKNSTGSFSEIFFLDYMIDSTSRAVRPVIGTQKFLLADNIPGVGIGIYKKDPAIYGEQGENYIGLVFLIRGKDGNQAGANYFSSYPSTYYYKAYDVNSKTWTGTFELRDGSINTITIK